MYVRQEGFLPRLTWLVGRLFFGLSVGFVLYGFTLFLLGEIVFGAFAYTSTVVSPVFLYFSVLASGIFPDVKLDEKGLCYRYLWWFTGTINWDEIQGARPVRRNWAITKTIAILVDRKGYSLFFPKGLYVNSIYARFCGSHHPVLLIASLTYEKLRIATHFSQQIGDPQILNRK